MFQTKGAENQNTRLMFNNLFFAVYEIMWKNMVQPDRPQMTTWRIRIAYCITKATNTHSEYVIFIIELTHFHKPPLHHTSQVIPKFASLPNRPRQTHSRIYVHPTSI